MKKRTIWIVIAILAVLAIGGGAYALIVSPKSPKVVTTGSPSSQPSSASRDNGQSADSSGSSAGAANPQECQSKDFSASISSAQGAAGSAYYDLSLVNNGKNSCFTEGYPGISLVNDNEQQIGSAADKDNSVKPTKITIAAGKAVTVTVRVPQAANFPSGKCQAGATQLKIYLPDDTTSFSTTTDITTWCPGFSVSAIQASS